MRNCITEDRKGTQGNSEEIKAISFSVYGDPVSKLRPRTVRNKGSGKAVHTFTPQKTVDQEKKIALVYKSIYGSFKFEKNVPLRVEVDFFLKIPKSTSKKKRQKMNDGENRPTKKVGDTDNYLKCATDSINGIAYDDDSQIVEIIGRKFYSDQPRTEILIMRVGGDGNDLH